MNAVIVFIICFCLAPLAFMFFENIKQRKRKTEAYIQYLERENAKKERSLKYYRFLRLQEQIKK